MESALILCASNKVYRTAIKDKPIHLELETREGRNGSTDCQGNIYLTQKRIDKARSGCLKLKDGLPVDADEADSIATLWHEITHNRNNVAKTYLSPLQRERMEVANEFVARKTLPEFYEAFGGKIQYEELMKSRRSTIYNMMVRNYDSIIKDTGADYQGAVESVKKHLFNESYTDQENGLINAITNNGAKIDRETAENLVAKCNSYDEYDFKHLIKKSLIKH